MKAKLLITTFEKEATATESGGPSGNSNGACGGCVSVEQKSRPNITAADVLRGLQSIGQARTAPETQSIKACI